MGYVPPNSLMKKFKDGNEQERMEACKQMLAGYDNYKRGMRSGIFGAIIGKAIFSDPDKPRSSDANKTRK